MGTPELQILLKKLQLKIARYPDWQGRVSGFFVATEA
jgi:hypothetical protein